MPGIIPFNSVVRPIFTQILLTALVFFMLYYKNKDIHRASFLAGFAMFYFSSTGHLYRLLPLRSIPAAVHLIFVILGAIILVILGHPLLWKKYLTAARLPTITIYLNLVAVISLFLPGIQIGKALFAMAGDAETPWTQLAAQNQTPQTLITDPSPDIYYIILDGYTRQDVLQDVFGFDNGEFIEALRRMGFYVAEDSHSNYMTTVVSLSSSLNMNYLDFTQKAAGKDSTNILPLLELIHHNLVRKTLEEAGYTTVAVSTDFPYTDWKDAGIYLFPYKNDLSELERFFYSMTALGAFYDPEFPFTKELREIFPIPSYGTRRDRIEFAFNQLKEIPKIKGPKFVFVHIIAPHPPFVFDALGNPLIIDRPYLPGDGMGFGGGIEEYQSFYVNQLKFVNTEILSALHAILTDSSTPPIIIIQGDHGSGSLLRYNSLEESCMYERTSILNAYFMPGGREQLLYSNITPVNSFRIVFNTYFNTNYPVLSDQIFYSPPDAIYDFRNITNLIESSCSN